MTSCVILSPDAFTYVEDIIVEREEIGDKLFIVTANPATMTMDRLELVSLAIYLSRHPEARACLDPCPECRDPAHLCECAVLIPEGS